MNTAGPGQKMNPKVRTAAISTGMNTLLTVAKFASWYFTGSLAILAEAWHSFSDIATSLLVWIALRYGASPETDRPAKAADDAFGKDAAPVRRWTAEEVSSILIGGVLLWVSVSLFEKVITPRETVISNPLIVGALFCVFALGSYGVYRYETAIGLESGSIGLVSDGLHAKSDTISSALAGGSLILYHFGLDLDRPAAALIALLILSLSIEISVRAILERRRRLASEAVTFEEALEFKSIHLLLAAFDPATYGRVGSRLESFLGLRVTEHPIASFMAKNAKAAFAAAALAAYLSTGLVVCGPADSVVVERFGRLRSVPPLGPGLHIKLPWPFETAMAIDTGGVRTIDIGNIVTEGSEALLWTREHGAEQPFLSGDNNFFYPYISIHYRVVDPVKFMNLHGSPEETIRQTASRIATRIFAEAAFFRLLAEDRRSLAGVLMNELQANLEAINLGVSMVDLTLRDIHPPVNIADSFEAVVASIQEKQTMILNGFSYFNSELPRARANSFKKIQNSLGFKAKSSNEARGNSAKFLILDETFRQTRRATAMRLYLDAIGEALRGNKIVVVDPRAGRHTMYVNSSKIPKFGSDWGD